MGGREILGITKVREKLRLEKEERRQETRSAGCKRKNFNVKRKKQIGRP